VIQRIQMYWISGILEQSLSHSMSLPLQLKEHPLLVANPWSLDVQEAMSRPPSVLHQATSIVKAYDDAEGELLIIGEAGAGKTTLLLQLTRALLQRAREDETHPLPVVFHLSSWAEKRLSLADWLIEELKSKYQVPRTLAQQWVTNETILPLLDGLDEVVASHRAACVETINHYRQEHSLPMVVCSRSAEYLAQGISLRLHRAVVVQPLTPSQVDSYLLRMLPHPTVLRDALAQDEVLRDMATNPLTLSTMAVAYRDQPLSQQLMTRTTAQRRTLILSHYVERILTNRGPKTAFTFSQTRRYFTWLAQEMLKHNQVAFYLERLQPDWLPTVSLRDRYEKVALRLIYGLEIIVTTALYAWMRGGKVGGSMSTFGVGAGLFGQLGAGPGNTVFAWMAPGLGGGVEAGGSLGLIFTLVFSITTLLIGGSPFPLSWISIVHALKQGVKHLFIAGGVVSILCLVIFSIFGGWRHGLIYGGGAGIFAGVVIGLLSVFANLREEYHKRSTDLYGPA
jgi:NACHT domain-containing protein